MADDPSLDYCSSPPPTIFVVDDDPAVLRSLSRLLRSEGLAVVTFSSACDFLEHHNPNLPGCLILDVAMPGMNGLELQAALIANGHEQVIVFLTGHGDIPMSVAAMQNGAVGFLSKPVNDEDLLNTVRLALETDRLRREKRRRQGV